MDYLKQLLTLAREDIKGIALNNNSIVLIRNSIEQWLTKKKRLDARLLVRYRELSRELSLSRTTSKGKTVDLSSAGLNKTLEYYANQRRKVRSLADVSDITDLFKDGYELIHRIREILTGQEITYSILYTPNNGDVSGETLMEVKLTLSQILSGVTLATSDVNTVAAGTEITNSTQLLINNAAVKNIIATLQEQTQNISSVLSNLDSPTLWNSLVSFRDQRNAKFKGNLGQLYEVYSVLRRDKRYNKINYIGHTSGGKNTTGLAEKLLGEAISNNDPGWQIGDIGLEQLKSVANGAASLMSGSTIEKILQQVHNALLQQDAAGMEQALQDIYTVDREIFNNEMDEKAQEEAIAAIKESVAELFDN